MDIMAGTRAVARRFIRHLGAAVSMIRRVAGIELEPAKGSTLTPESVASPAESAGKVREHPALRFASPGHFYSPIPDLAELSRRASQIFREGVVDVPGIDLREKEQLVLLKRLRKFYSSQPFTDEKTAGLRYYFNNPQYSYSDAIFYHCMLRELEPRHVIEVGSGFSSCVALDTDDVHLGRTLELTCIEPYPEALKALLKPGDTERISLLPVAVQDVEPKVFARLKRNDILFIDSTHVVKVGGDVNRIIFEVLPALASGVYVHVHDVFYPFEYPRHWFDEGRVWSEAYLLRAFLQYNSEFEIVLFNTYLEMRFRSLFERQFPLCLKNPGGSIWIRRR